MEFDPLFGWVYTILGTSRQESTIPSKGIVEEGYCRTRDVLNVHQNNTVSR